VLVKPLKKSDNISSLNNVKKISPPTKILKYSITAKQLSEGQDGSINDADDEST